MTEYFRFGFPSYGRKSVFKDKIEIILDKSGAVIGATNGDKLENLHIPRTAEDLSLTEIADRAFMNMDKLKTVIIENGIEEIGNEAFSGCKSLIAITIPDSVYRIGEGAFENCISLKATDLPKNIEILGSRAFYGCNSLTSIALNDSIKKIGAMAFASTKNLRAIKLPNNLAELSEGLFMNSGIERIEIPSSVSHIGSAAFSEASRLTEIYYSGTIDQFRRIRFGLHWNKGIPQSAILFVRDSNGCYYNAFAGNIKEEEKPQNEKKEKALTMLGLRDGCCRSEIERAFRLKAKDFHPDVLSGKNLAPEFTEFAASRFRELQEAEQYLLSLK